MRITALFIIILLFFASCQDNNHKDASPKVAESQTNSEPQWTFQKSISLEGIGAIGIAKAENSFWISDGDNNRLVQINNEGTIISEKGNFERPMHLAYAQGKLFVPSYGTDEIIIIENNERVAMGLKDSLDAPAGVDFLFGNTIIADFYNHRLLYLNNGKEISIGKKGKADGEFHYPTDVQLTKDKIYVADAYNNRIQVFDRSGKHLLTFGKEHKMNATTGIFVSDHHIFVTDFENDRVLIFDINGQLLQIITEGLEKPTDLLLDNNLLYIINYKSQKMTIFGQ